VYPTSSEQFEMHIYCDVSALYFEMLFSKIVIINVIMEKTATDSLVEFHFK